MKRARKVNAPKRRVAGPKPNGISAEFEEVDFDFSSLPEPKPYIPPPIDLAMGYLYGEIIWETKLSHYTYENVTTHFCTREERTKYDAIHKEYMKNIFTDKRESEEQTEIWKKELKYAKELERKYFPAEIEYRAHLYVMPTDTKVFVQGIRSYLWNTDHCAYDLADENVTITADWRGYDLRIKFTLEA